MILLNINIAKKSYSQERADRLAAEREIMQAKKDKLVYDIYTSICCKSKIETVLQPLADINEVREIKVCSACKSEAPSLSLFGNDYDKVIHFFIDIAAHRTNNVKSEY